MSIFDPKLMSLLDTLVISLSESLELDHLLSIVPAYSEMNRLGKSIFKNAFKR